MVSLERQLAELTKDAKTYIEKEYGSVQNAKDLLDLDKEKAGVLRLKEEGLAILDEWINRPSVLQHNDCSRLHKLIESQTDGSGFSFLEDGATEPLDAKKQLEVLSTAKSFVVTHDWALVFKDHLDEEENTQFRLPFPHCCFEMRVSGLVVMALVSEAVSPDAPINIRLYANVVNELWLNFVPTHRAKGDHFDFMHRQVIGICIALEAEVATHELNEKRIKNGKMPLKDYHVVSLARKHSADATGNSEESARKVRMHFRRGHWRHFEKSKTWIKWMLVGDPKLGFIDKHYKF